MGQKETSELVNHCSLCMNSRRQTFCYITPNSRFHQSIPNSLHFFFFCMNNSRYFSFNILKYFSFLFLLVFHFYFSFMSGTSLAISFSLSSLAAYLIPLSLTDKYHKSCHGNRGAVENTETSPFKKKFFTDRNIL